MAYDADVVEFLAPIKVLINGEMLETTIGRIMFNQIVPDALGYQNTVMDKKGVAKVIARSFEELGTEVTAQFVDDLKNIGFTYAERSGITFALSDIVIPGSKDEVLEKADAAVDEIDKQYRRGLITKDEQYVKTVEIWLDASKVLETDVIKGFTEKNPIMTIFKSGARGTMTNLNQIAGMKGLVANPSGAIIEIPLKNNFKEGLSVFEYFISTHGSRKGRADTALRTSDAGYLTRRLVDVAQDVVIAETDCGSDEGVTLYKSDELQFVDKFEDSLLGRFTVGEQAGVKANTFIDEEVAKKLAVLDEVVVRSPLYCHSAWGICQHCYGKNLASGLLVEHGEAVGIIAAQAIGEPGTQLTMKTFHMGGVAQTGGDITAGLPRVEELFEARSPKTPAIMAEIDGKVRIEERPEDVLVTILSDKSDTQLVHIPKGYTVVVQAKDKVAPKDILAESKEGRSLRATLAGTVSIEEGKVIVTAHETASREYTISNSTSLKVENGDIVTKGQALTEGHLDLQQLLTLTGRKGVERYIVNEVQSIYSSQGQTIHNKHIEIIIRQMLSKVQVVAAGNSEYISGQTIEQTDFRAADKAGHTVEADQQLLGITRISLRTKSFLSAASFQETTSVLIDAAVQGKRDELRGLKENVIIGKLIPAGTGYQQEEASSN